MSYEKRTQPSHYRLPHGPFLHPYKDDKHLRCPAPPLGCGLLISHSVTDHHFVVRAQLLDGSMAFFHTHCCNKAREAGKLKSAGDAEPAAEPAAAAATATATDAASAVAPVESLVGGAASASDAASLGSSSSLAAVSTASHQPLPLSTAGSMSDDAADDQRSPQAHDNAHDSAGAEQSNSEATTGSATIKSALVRALIEHEWRKDELAKGVPTGTAPDVTLRNDAVEVIGEYMRLFVVEAVRRCEADSEGNTITRRDLQRRILELTNDF